MQVVDIDFATLTFYDNYVVSEIVAGENIDKDKVDVIVEVLNAQFEDKPFAYISHRVHDYSIDPSQTRRLVDETGLVIAAFVLKRIVSIGSFEAERVFYKVPTAGFSKLDNAVSWVKAEMAKL